jgi:hypothetical protein
MGNQWTSLRLAGAWTLGEVRWHWSGAYAITSNSGCYRAQRRDHGGTLTASSLDALVSKIRADYRAVPVPR